MIIHAIYLEVSLLVSLWSSLQPPGFLVPGLYFEKFVDRNDEFLNSIDRSYSETINPSKSMLNLTLYLEKVFCLF